MVHPLRGGDYIVEMCSLAELIVDQVESNQEGLYQIGRLVKKGASKKTWEGLRTCTEKYHNALMFVDVCRQAFPRSPKFAVDHMDGAEQMAG
ncbi:hypothetical protein CDL15_Pgr016595 [Punica granatum]|uniref:Pectinesterase inhibitor domain-containing protein n=1 Tax=Punica granatum TaxID=22663 RepID=A0A218XUT1_PUNGR|nr:hypothetical protein CDL15_Pgr016595 [Punica granatum]